MIETKTLKKSFGDKTALADVSLKLPNGEKLGIFGKKGAGKTTLLSLLCGAVTPSYGSVKINGFDLAAEGNQAKRLIGVADASSLPERMTVLEWLRFCSDVRGMSGMRADRQIGEAVDLACLGGLEHRVIGNLEEDEKVRTAVAGALLGKTEFLLIDEPTNGLFGTTCRLIRTILNRVSEMRTLIFTSENPEDAKKLCTRAIVLENGTVKADLSPDEFDSLADLLPEGDEEEDEEDENDDENGGENGDEETDEDDGVEEVTADGLDRKGER